MSWNVKTDAVTGMMKFSLTDDDGESVASFRLNPTDVRMASRFQEVAGWFENLSKNAPSTATVEEVKSYNDALEEKLAYILGGNSRETLFGVIPAVNIMPSGLLFAVEVFDKLTEVVIPEIINRRQKMQTAVSKHTIKYVPTIPDEAIKQAMEAAGVK